ncbi:hypothetical protein [Paracoccus sanguinis]|uniref:Uncharacterized protein n=1 Tax=Paracoccus sanguinis TaxID=1545044 RepID=A0A1H2S3M3_9RHOB|nr:hypothetical protein [Paracoccus sanguinis]KGJ18640.1 hypothetical protein IX57_03255 [Paracoccus sanguinis]SDW26211.1 hypothetical protein SAMN05444276_101527 [Paracoccus sanguinis]
MGRAILIAILFAVVAGSTLVRPRGAGWSVVISGSIAFAGLLTMYATSLERHGAYWQEPFTPGHCLGNDVAAASFAGGFVMVGILMACALGNAVILSRTRT